jgi:MFS family permease
MIYVFSFLKNLQFFGALAVPFYTERIGFNYTQMFLMELIFSVSLFLFEVPTGIVADRYGRRISLFAGSLLFGGSFIFLGTMRSLTIFVMIQIVSAFGFSLMSGADRALIYENAKLRGKSEPETAEIAARYDAFGTAGMLIAFPAGSLFAASGLIPYTRALGVVLVVTGICIVIAGFTILAVKEAPLCGRRMDMTAAFRHGVDGVTFAVGHELRQFSLNYAAISAFTFLMFWFYQSLLLDNAVPVGWNGFIAAGFNAGSMLLLLAAGPLRKKLGTGNTLFLSSLIPGILYFGVFLFPRTLPVVITAIFGITMLRAFRAPLLVTLMNDKISNENRATVLSGVSMLERIIISLFYPFAGILLDHAGRWTYFAAGTITVAASVLLAVSEKKTGTTTLRTR